MVIIESTSPVGTTEHVKDMLASLRKDLEMPTEDERGDICIAYCPERVLPGNILHELQELAFWGKDLGILERIR